MTMSSNFNSIFKKFSHKIFQFGKIRKYINTAMQSCPEPVQECVKGLQDPSMLIFLVSI